MKFKSDRQRKAVMATLSLHNAKSFTQNPFIPKKEKQRQYKKLISKFSDNFKYQDTHQENIIHEKWDKGNSYRYILEGAGDIFREATKKDYTHYPYIYEKILRIEKYIDEKQEHTLNPEDSYEYSKNNNEERFNRLKSEWNKQSTDTYIEKESKKLNLALLDNDLNQAKESISNIKTYYKRT